MESSALGQDTGDAGEEVVAGDLDGDGQTVNEGDCDDGNPRVHSGAQELCDGLDNDCDGETDENAVDAGTWYSDADGDGYGAPESVVHACSAPLNSLADGTDCDDANPAIHPGATETMCDGLDNDCDDAGVPEVAFAGDEEFTSVDDAAALAIELGETAWVCPGRHEARIVVEAGETLEIASWSGSPDDTILDGGSKWTILALLPGSMATVHELGLEHGEGELWRAVDSWEGGGIYVHEATLELEECSLRYNHSDYVGGAISATSDGPGGVDQAELWIRDSLFEENEAVYDGGAVYTDGNYFGYGRYSFVDSTIRSNRAGNSGAALYITDRTDADILLDGTTIRENESPDSAALKVGNFYSRFNIEIRDSSIVDNVSDGEMEIPVSIWSEDVSFTFEDSVVAGNAGGGVGFARHSGIGAITSTNTDWGEGATDNGDGHDVYFNGYYTFDGIVDFQCGPGLVDGGTASCTTTE